MRSIRSGFGARTRGISLEEKTDLSPEAAAAIGAGTDKVPLPKKEGEVPAQLANGEDPVAGDMDGTKGAEELKNKNDVGSSAVKKDGEVPGQLSNGEDPTVAVATGGEGKTKEIAGTAGALESRGAKAPKKVKFSPIQRARIKLALEDDGLTSEEAEAEIRKQEEPEAVAETPEVPGAEAPAVEVPEVPAAAEAPVVGDPAETAAGAEAAVGGEPGDGGAASLDGGAAEVPAVDDAAGLSDVPGSEAPLGDVPAAGDLGGDAAGGFGGEIVDDGSAINPVELDNARRMVAVADARLSGRPIAAPARGERRAPAIAPELPEAGREPVIDGLEGGALPTEVEAEAGQIEDNANGLETELAEVAEADDVVDEVQGRIEEGIEGVETLEAYRESLQIATESGGLDRHGAAVLKIGLESLYKRLELPMPYVVSLESFGGTSKKISASQLTLESIGASIKEIWDKIIKAIMHGIEVMQQWAAKVEIAATLLEKRATAIAAQVKGVSGNPSAREFEDESLARALVLNGQVAQGVSSIKLVQQITAQIYKGYPDGVRNCDQMIGMIESAASHGNMETLQGEASKLQEVPQELTGLLKHTSQDGDTVVKSSDPLPGNMVLYVAVNPAEMENGGGIKGGMKEADNAREPSSAKLPVLGAADMTEIATAVAALAKTIRACKQDVAAANAVKKKAVALGQKLAGMNQDDAPHVRELRVVVTGLIAGLDQPFKDFNSYAIRTANAALVYVQKSLAMRSSAAKPAAPATPAEAPAKV